MIAENFYRTGFNIFYPRVNWAGNTPGYVGTEFPLVPFIASMVYGVFGVHDWIGRSISVLFYTVSCPSSTSSSGRLLMQAARSLQWAFTP